MIKDDGTVVDITGHVEIPSDVHFNGDKELVATGTYDQMINVYDIPTADITTANFKRRYSYQEKPQIDIPNDTAYRTNDIVSEDNTLYIARQKGLLAIDENKSNKTSSLVSFIASDYNTGWMNGDIKLATLSDTDTTNVTGSELVSQTASGWTLPTGFSHNGSGTLTAASNTGQYQKAYDAVNTVVGKDYTITFNVTAKSGSMSFWIANSTSYTSAFATQNPISGTGIKSFSFTATSTSMYVVFQCNALGNTLTVTDISLRLAESDRSVNNNALQVFGTVTKTAVATGADLVAYSGFSNSTFMVQPYNSDLDFGTGDFSIMGWINVGSSVSAYASILSRVLSANTETNAWSLRIDSSANNYYFYTNNTSLFTSPLTRLTWQFLTVARRSGVVYFYVDGAFRATNSMANTITNVGASVVVGYESTHNMGNSSVALWRISATAPTAEQITKMYNDEKHLFQENAKATLYGTSDAVTALAYDDSTELLHVGTSAGRSEFQGLNRVNNTTDAVSAAISASNGFIVEE